MTVQGGAYLGHHDSDQDDMSSQGRSVPLKVQVHFLSVQGN